MDEQRKKQAEEIAKLREEQGMTFRAISEKLRLSPGKVSYLYQELQKQRRIDRYWQLRERQNQISVSLPLTLGEGLVLQKILSSYELRTLRENSRYFSKGFQSSDDPDLAVAKGLLSRLSAIDQKTREKNKQGE